VSTPVNSSVMGMTLTGEKEAPTGLSVSGMTNQQKSGSGLKTIHCHLLVGRKLVKCWK
jgi:hypothetical protein